MWTEYVVAPVIEALQQLGWYPFLGVDRDAKLWARRRAGAAGLLWSLLFHVCVVLLLLVNTRGHLVGEARASPGGGELDAYNGQAMTVVLFSPARTNDVGTTDTISPPSDPASAASSLTADDPKPDGEIPVEAEAKATQTGAAAADQGAQAQLTQRSNPAAAAAANGVPALPASEQGGDPNGDEDLLRQIARCLPPGLHPVLPTARLTLELDQTGSLRVAPTMFAPLPYASAEDVKNADEIVAAALQCGPYKSSAPPGQQQALVPDFSFLANLPSPGTAGAVSPAGVGATNAR